MCLRTRGLIPAHAGKTPSSLARSVTSRAHPRSRGENGLGRRGNQANGGSSPLTRGKRAQGRAYHVGAGLIPAHAGKTGAWWPHGASPRAHPRSRGENYLAACLDCGVMGSSPLTRGKRAIGCGHHNRRGLIPAHAGKTSPSLRWRNRAWAHPRSRGENIKAKVAACCASGSSPLTRGKQSFADGFDGSSGLIPAHAGKTRGWALSSLSLPAHPRSRGENVLAAPMIVLIWGSSPLTRGKLHPRARLYACRRLIPAHAGKTLRSTRIPSSIWGSSPLTRGKLNERRDLTLPEGLIPAHAGKTSTSSTSTGCITAHPRSRGENRYESASARSPLGSSPLTRGKRLSTGSPTRSRRLIPAHAGKTFHRGCRAWRRPAHPRSRGENILAAPMIVLIWGSSPLTRGKRPPGSPIMRIHGLIPAHAGKTVPCVAATCHLRAHPRSRGENTVQELDFLRAIGSSPLTRGKLPGLPRAESDCGLIPAHAGKTSLTCSLTPPPRAHPRSRGENVGLSDGGAVCTGSSPLTRGKPLFAELGDA